MFRLESTVSVSPRLGGRVLVRLALGCGLASGCAPQPAPQPGPTPTPASTPTQSAPAATTTVAARPVEAAPPAITGLAGDDQLPEPWRTRFRAWLAAQSNPTYVAVLSSQVSSNAVAVVLQRRTEVNGVCLQGPSKLDLIEDERAPELTREVAHFGDDCCTGTECVRTADGWNLRYLALLAAKNWKELSLLVPARRHVVWNVNGGEIPTVRLTRKQVAAGQFHDAPACGLIYNVPSCDPLDSNAASFTCHCDGGGSHVTFTWEREGGGFVLVAIAEESH